MRLRAAPLIPLMLAACVAQTDGEPEIASPSPTPSAAGMPAAPPPPASPERPDFAFDGALEQGGWLRGRVPSGTVAARLGETPLAFDQAGYFFAAFDRDHGPEARLTATLADGRAVTRTIAVAPRAWDIERVNVARTPGGTSEAFMARRRPELEAIWNARQRDTGAQGWRQDFIWPARGRISGRFGSQRIYRGGEAGSFHSGIDIAAGPGGGGNGDPFVAPADGVVVLAETGFSLEGQLLIIDHGQGLNSAFLHASRLLVREGDRVRQGQHIGDIGASGRATGPHLHWGLVWRDQRLDPLLFTGPMR